MKHPKMERVRMLKKLNKSIPIKKESARLGYSLKQIADAHLDVEKSLSEAIGKNPNFTGKTRVFRNGTIAYEIRCKKCKELYWVTTIFYPFCVDCDKVNLFRN